jgi:hypothetical protein
MDNPNKKMIAMGVQFMIATALVVGAMEYIKVHPVSTLFHAGTKEKEVAVMLTASNVTPNVGDTYSITPILVSKSKKPGYIELTLTYDAKHLQYVNIEDVQTAAQFESLMPVEDAASADSNNSMHTLFLTYGIKDPTQLPGDTVELAKINFKILNPAKSLISVDSGKSQIVFVDQDTAELLNEPVTVDSSPKVATTPAETTPVPVITTQTTPEAAVNPPAPIVTTAVQPAETETINSNKLETLPETPAANQ